MFRVADCRGPTTYPLPSRPARHVFRLVEACTRSSCRRESQGRRSSVAFGDETSIRTHCTEEKAATRRARTRTEKHGKAIKARQCSSVFLRDLRVSAFCPSFFYSLPAVVCVA